MKTRAMAPAFNAVIYGGMPLHQDCDWKTMNQAAKQLRDALLEAEEMYLDAEDE